MNASIRGAAALLFAAACALAAATARAQDKPANNGTDPTKLTTIAQPTYEYLDLLGGFESGVLRLNYTQPFGEKSDYSLRLRVPVQMNDVLGNAGHDLGDASVMLTHVFGLTRTHGWVVQGEAVFDTAARPELGTGKNVLKGTLIYARFLPTGAIFAPAVVQSNSVSGQARRADVNTTTFDFYYVPKLADPRNLITVDPAVNFDWENDKEFLSLAVTYGRVTGPAFGGIGIVTVKPTLFAGGDRPADWGIEIGYKLLGF
jgi:hypothetical protein